MAPIHHRTKNQEGFTLIELLVVMIIIGLLAALVVPKMFGKVGKAQRQATQAQIELFGTALDAYRLDVGSYPTTEQGLRALVEKPTVGVIPKNWKLGGYMQKVPEDPWGSLYKYLSPSPRGDYEVMSLGGDGEPGGEGKNADITNFNLDKD